MVLDLGSGTELDIGFEVSVAVAASPGDATGGGTDYTYTTEVVRFDAGALDGAIWPINIAIVGDLIDEADETIELPGGVAAASADIVFDPGGTALSNDTIQLTNPAGTRTVTTSIIGRVTIS